MTSDGSDRSFGLAATGVRVNISDVPRGSCGIGPRIWDSYGGRRGLEHARRVRGLLDFSLVSQRGKAEGHAFLSYVREDVERVDRLGRTLEAAGIPVWRDTRDLWPGQDWRLNIRHAISDQALVFIACFSRVSVGRDVSYQNEELLLAIDQLRLRPPERPWLIPVRFDDCQIPDRDLGGGRTLSSIQRADLFGGGSNMNAMRLVATVLQILDRRMPAAASVVVPRTRRVEVDVRIVEPEDQDSGMRVPVRSVVYVTAAEPIGDVTASFVTHQGHGGTAGLGYGPSHVSTRTWRIRSEHLLRSVEDVIIGYTVVDGGRKVQWFQYGGYDLLYDWRERGADGSHLSALMQIRKIMMAGRGADQH
jgi:hypothetical protein